MKSVLHVLQGKVHSLPVQDNKYVMHSKITYEAVTVFLEKSYATF